MVLFLAFLAVAFAACATKNNAATCSSCTSCCQTSNPSFTKQCQMNVVFILDNSISIQQAGACGAVRNAATAFVNGIQNIVNVGGAAKLGVIKFDTNSVVSFPLTAVTPTFITSVNNWVKNTYCTSNGFTNWTSALLLAKNYNWGDQVDVFVWFTDGYPQYAQQPFCSSSCYAQNDTAFSQVCSPTCTSKNRGSGNSATNLGTGVDVSGLGPNTAEGLWSACNSADQLKATGAKLLLIGVGDVLGHEDEIRLVTGPMKWDLTPATFGSSDYALSTDYSQLTTILSRVVTGLCSCLQDQPQCLAVGNSCCATRFDARVRITTQSTISSTFPSFSVTHANIFYSFVPSPDTRVAYEFYSTNDTVASTSPQIVRTDIQNPCSVQRIVQCGGGNCYTVGERQAIPRFFREANDTLGTSGATNVGPAGCTGYTKVYNAPPFPSTITPEWVRFIWVLTSTNTPCAAEAYDGTFFEFFTNSALVRGTNNLCANSTYNFKPNITCNSLSCGRDVELVFVIDEQSSIDATTFDRVKNFAANVMNQFNTSSASTRFGAGWTNVLSDQAGAGNPTTLQSSSPNPPNFQSNVVINHIQQGGTSADYAGRVTTAVNKFWPTASANGIPRRLVTVVVGNDIATTGANGNRYATLRTLLNSRGIEFWAVGVNNAASNIALLANLSSTNNFVHYQTITDSAFLANQVSSLAGQICPQGSLCGNTCGGFCSCVPTPAAPNTCSCPNTCVSSQCVTRTCPSASVGCIGAPRDCSDGDACTFDDCNPLTGCNHTAITCVSPDPCQIASCSPTSGCIYTAKNCDDQNVCTTDGCSNGTCTHVDISSSCNDGKACTVDTCSSLLGCRYSTLTCNDNSLCTTDSCNNATGCVFTPIAPCDDNNVCTSNACVNSTGCVFTPITCPDINCTTKLCDPVLGCRYTAVTCNDGNACTNDSCNNATNQCQYVTKSCSDNDLCTTDTCNNKTGCINSPVGPNFCPTPPPCMSAVCVSPTGCQNQTILNCSLCGSSPCVVTANACQTQHCVDVLANCQNVPLANQSACTLAVGAPGKFCYVTNNAPCDDQNNCTNDTCDPATGCKFDPITCDSGAACIIDSCDVHLGCVKTPRVCSDGNPCTVDSCNNSTGCDYSVATNCSDGNACTTDTCDTQNGCVHTALVCPSFICNPGTCNNVTGCTSTTLNCDDLNACTTDSCSNSSGCIHTQITCTPPDACHQVSCSTLTGCHFNNTCFNTSCTIRNCNSGTCEPVDHFPCNDNDPCTVDSCSESAGGCVYSQYNCTQPSDCFKYVCSGDNGSGGANCTIDFNQPVVCDDHSSCTTDRCEQGVGCVYTNVTCNATTLCDFPVGCDGSGSQPNCIVANITSLFDFCGDCLGDNTACFFSSLIGAGSAAGIAGGIVAAIVVACIIAALIAAYFSKRGYDYYINKSDFSSSGAQSNPYFKGHDNEGQMPQGLGSGGHIDN